MIADAQARMVAQRMIQDIAVASDAMPIPFERQTEPDGLLVTRGLREYHDDATGQTIYGGALIFVSESRAEVARALERYGPLEPDTPIP